MKAQEDRKGLTSVQASFISIFFFIMVSVILYLVIHSITLKRLVKDALQLETIGVQSAGIDKNPLYLFKVTVSVVESLLL